MYNFLLAAFFVQSGCSQGGCSGWFGGTDDLAPPLEGIEQLFATYDQSCALTGEGDVYCAGSDRLADEDPVPPLARPVPGLEGVAAVMRGMTNCARRVNGSVACWGGNPYLVVPTKGKESHYRAIDVPGLEAIDLLVVSDRSAPSWARVASSGVALAWGGSVFNREFKAPTPDPDLDLRGAVQAVYANRVCVRTEAGAVRCWRVSIEERRRRMAAERMPPDMPSDVVDIAIRDGTFEASGRQRTPQLCLLRSSGAVRCLELGQVGKDTPPAWASNPFTERDDWRDLDMFLAHQCGVTRGGEVWCSGYNGRGQLGRPEPLDSDRLLQVPEVSGATSVTVGRAHTCATLADGTAMCWGSNSNDRCGHGTQSKVASPGLFRYASQPAPPSQ